MSLMLTLFLGTIYCHGSFIVVLAWECDIEIVARPDSYVVFVLTSSSVKVVVRHDK